MRTARPNINETERVRRLWDKEAPIYDLSMGFWDKVFFRGDRAWVCRQARGAVLEIAVGTGRNLEHYPNDVKLTAIDISRAMLERARRRATALEREVDLRIGDAQALAFSDASFDTVVCTFSLCSIPDDRKAIAEIKRVLRPGGANSARRARAQPELAYAQRRASARGHIELRAFSAGTARRFERRAVRGRSGPA